MSSAPALILAVAIAAAALGMLSLPLRAAGGEDANGAGTNTAAGEGLAMITHTVRLDQPHQTIQYFAASDCWTFAQLESWSIESREKLADLLFDQKKGIGLSGWRMNLGGGLQRKSITHPFRTAETFEVEKGKYDWDRLAPQRWFLTAARDRGVGNFTLFANSPPMRLTRNGLTNLGDDHASSTNLKDGAEREYAQYLCDVLEHFAKAPREGRVVFDGVSPINEPQWDWNGGSQEGNRAANDDIVRTCEAVARELHKRRLKTHLDGVESASIPGLWHADQKYGKPYGDYLDLICPNPLLKRAMNGVIGYHSYWSDDIDTQLVQNRVRAKQEIAKHPGWQLAQTEYCIMQHKRAPGIDSALFMARVMHVDLAIADVVGWSWWLAMSESDYQDGLLGTDWRKPGDAESIITPKRFYAFGNFSKFVRPGMQRVTLDGCDAKDVKSLVATAWINPRTGEIAVVYINSGDVPQRIDLHVARGRRDMTPSRMQPHITSDAPGDDLRDGELFNPADGYTIPSKSIVTLTGNWR